MDQTYYIEGRISSMGHMLSCLVCKRKILVEIALCGVNHNVGVMVTCADCMRMDSIFVQKYPEIARQISEWQKEERSDAAKGHG